MKRMRHSVRAFMATALFAVVAAVLFVLSAKRPPGDTVGMSLASCHRRGFHFERLRVPGAMA
jgi:hypothetical protein